MHAFRSHTCAELTEANVGQPVRLSGWVNRKRDHGQLVFVDLRDHYGLTQCVVDSSDPTFAAVEATRLESVVTITGTVLKRSDDTINTSLPTGHIEVRIEQFEVVGCRHAAAAGQFGCRFRRRDTSALSLSRPAPVTPA